MNDFDGSDERVMVSPGGRRRKLNPNIHKREVEKRLRHSSSGKVPEIACDHTANTASAVCHANKLSSDDIVTNFNKFYAKAEHAEQDRFLLQLMNITPVQRWRAKVADNDKQKDRNYSVKYSLFSGDYPNQVPVCKATGTFTKVLGISKDRVSRVAKYYAENGESGPERRGGARKVEENDNKRERIIQHIQSFHCRASHYGRREAPGRKYLPCDLTVRKLHQLFEEQEHANTSYSLYYSVFSSKFNLGFRHPATDACGLCASTN